MKSIFTLLIILFTLSIHAQQEQSSDTIYNMAGLDHKPEFPDGNFQSEVVKHFIIPDIDHDLNVRLYINFVIEKDGTMTDIKCTRDPGYGLCAVAEKAMKAITTKWKPGIEEGVPVRVSFTLPIVINVKADTPPQQDDFKN